MNTYRDMYAVQVNNRKKTSKPPRYLTGFEKRSDAETTLCGLHASDTYTYKVVYVREYFDPAVAREGHASVNSITEIPEYYSIEE